MRFTKFEIKNFRGIKHAVIDLEPAGSNIFTLIGLNESGKTTILKALETFSIIKESTAPLEGKDTEEENPVSYIPKDEVANFTGDIVVIAYVRFEQNERKHIAETIKEEENISIDPNSIPEFLEIERGYKFVDSTLTDKRIYTINLEFDEIIEESDGKQKKRSINEIYDSEHGEKLFELVSSEIERLVPKIIYFPTFLFDLPKKIILNPIEEEEDVLNNSYKQILENITNSLDSPLSLDKHIVKRLIAKDADTSEKKKQVQASFDRISFELTEKVFNVWKNIFNENFSAQDIVLQYGVDISRTVDRRSDPYKGKRVYVQFSIKDQFRTYDIAERSLGFRWFFSFLLFTLYKVAGADNQSILFLLDEPASNLHSTAQKKLLESFRNVVKASPDKSVQLMYSTHSHHLINPMWLEQAFIVSNQAINYQDDTETKFRYKKNLIQAIKYKQFVNYSSDTTYFQPILDRLEVTASMLEINQQKPIVLVEGKGDFFIIEYVRQVIFDEQNDFIVMPGTGATKMDPIIAFLLGLGNNFIVCLDSDTEGKDSKSKYEEEWGLENRIWTLAEILNDPSIKMIEDFLEDDDRKVIKDYFSGQEAESKNLKNKIKLFFSEKLATRDKNVSLSDKFKERVKFFDEEIFKKLSNNN